MSRDYYTAWELGLEPPPEVNEETKKEIVERLHQAVEEYLLIGTPRDLFKLIALQL